MGCQNFCQEFHCRNFRFWHWKKTAFSTSVLFWLPLFLIYRLVVSVVFVYWFIVEVVDTDKYPDGKYFIYYTHWTFTFTCLYFVYATILTLIELVSSLRSSQSQRQQEPDIALASHSSSVEVRSVIIINPANADDLWVGREDALLVHHKIIWLLYTIATNAGLTLSIGYWTIIYTGFTDEGDITAAGIVVHILNAVIMLIETAISNVPVRVFHTLYTIIYSVIYIIFTLVYWQAGGTNPIDGNAYIYEDLNWGNIDTTITAILPFFMLFVIPPMQLVFYGIYKVRVWIASKCGSRQVVYPESG